MKIIPEEMIEKTWPQITAFNPIRANKEIMKIGNDQREFSALVTASTRRDGSRGEGLGIYMFFVVYRMFQKAQGKIKRISSEEIIKCHERDRAFTGKI